LLKEAIASGRPIRIKNGPVNHPDYLLFWEKQIADGEIDSARIHHQQGYEWAGVAKNISVSQVSSEAIYHKDCFLLNANSLSRLFDGYSVCNASQMVFKKEGLLPLHQKKAMTLTLTGPLHEHQWALLLDRAA